jgi:hypothetical protein
MNRALSAVFHYWRQFSSACYVDEMWIAWKSRRKHEIGLDWAQSAADRNGGFVQPNAAFVRCQCDYS